MRPLSAVLVMLLSSVSAASAQSLARFAPSQATVFVEMERPAALITSWEDDALLSRLFELAGAPVRMALNATRRLDAQRLAIIWREPGLFRSAGWIVLAEGASRKEFGAYLSAIGQEVGKPVEVSEGILGASRGAGLSSVLQQGGPPSPLSEEVEFQALGGAQPARIRAYLDAEALFPPFMRRAALAPKDPFGALFAGGPLALIARARQAVIRVTFEDAVSLSARVRLFEPWEEHAYLERSTAAPILEAGPTEVARLSLQRDLAKYWEHRERLAPAESEAQFLQLQSQASLFLGQTTFEDLLARLGTGWDLHLFREQAGEKEALPALAFTTRLEDDAVAREIIVAFQMFVGYANLQRTQRGEPRFLTTTEDCHGTQLFIARYLAGARLDATDPLRFLSPTLAHVQGRLILASDPAAARHLVEAELGDMAAARPGSEELVLRGAGVARLLEDFRELAVGRLVLQEGLTLEEASARFGVITGLMRRLKELSLRVQLERDLATIDLEMTRRTQSETQR